MIERNKHYLAVEKSVERSPVTAILGHRQCGKTTLARSFGEPHQAHYFDLESVVDQRRLQNPELMLSSLDGVIIDDLIQGCRDRDDDKFLETAVKGDAQFIITGDQDLLIKHPFEGIDIVTVQEFAVYTV